MRVKAKKKKCRICKKQFNQLTPFHIVCSLTCSIAQANKDRAARDRSGKAELAKQRKIERQKHREAKERLKSLSDWLNEAQAVCNKYIRLRDADKPCISCGEANSGKYDAGHYQTVGSRPELRFHPFNIHKQCSWNCNKNLSGNIIEYRKGLIERIGVENVEWLENHHDYRPWTIEDAKDIKQYFKELIKGLK